MPISNNPSRLGLSEFQGRINYRRFVNQSLREEARLWTPYTYSQAGEDKWIILNRNYKPLGLDNQLGDFLDYSLLLPLNMLVTRSQIDEMIKLVVHQGIVVDRTFFTKDERWPGYLSKPGDLAATRILVDAAMKVL